MEHKLYNHHFEQFLKEATDNFRMYPSLHNWKSLYNNLHPGNKWPSLSAWLLILSGIFFAGHSNTSTFSEKNQQLPAVTGKIRQDNLYTINGIAKHSTVKKDAIKSFRFANKNGNGLKQSDAAKNASSPMEKISFISSAIKSVRTVWGNQPYKEINSTENTEPVNKSRKELRFDNLNTPSNSGILQSNDSKQSALAYQVYATQSIGSFNVLRNRMAHVPRNLKNPGNTADSKEDISSPLNIIPDINMEAGGALLMNVSKELRLKAGMQLNYTRYNVQTTGGSPAENNTAENSAAFIPAPQGYPTNEFSNYFNSSSYQISIPLGTELKIAGNNQFEWYAGATVQPSFLFRNSEPMSSSASGTLTDDLYSMRRWNVNTSFETFLSYKLKNGAVLNAGPQVRYQLMPTYDNRLNLNERLYNIGIKLGLSRGF